MCRLDLRAVVVRLERRLGERLQLLGETLGLGRPQGLVAGVVDAARLLLAPVVRDEDGEDLGRREPGVGVGTRRAAIAPWSTRRRAASSSGSPPRAARAAVKRTFSSIPMCLRIPARNSPKGARSTRPGSAIERFRSASRRRWSALKKR